VAQGKPHRGPNAQRDGKTIKRRLNQRKSMCFRWGKYSCASVLILRGLLRTKKGTHRGGGLNRGERRGHDCGEGRGKERGFGGSKKSKWSGRPQMDQLRLLMERSGRLIRLGKGSSEGGSKKRVDIEPGE